MNAEEKIEVKVGRDPGFRVPDGYFEAFYASMPEQLPERETPAPVHLTRWQRVKPYVYLAAMFAGIWCMMKMFHMMSTPDISLDSPPAAVMAALDKNPQTFDEMVPDYDMGDFELEQEVSDEFDDIDELTDALGVELEPQYEAMNVEPIIDAVNNGSH